MEIFALSLSWSIYYLTLSGKTGAARLKKTFALPEAVRSGQTSGPGLVLGCRQPVLVFDRRLLEPGTGLWRHVLFGVDVVGFADNPASFWDAREKRVVTGPIVALAREEYPLRDIIRRATPHPGCPRSWGRVRKDLLRLNWAQSRRILTELDVPPKRSRFFLATILRKSPFFLATTNEKGRLGRLRLTEALRASAAS